MKMKIFCSILGIIFIINPIFLLAVSAYDISFLASFGLGVILLVYAFLYNSFEQFCKESHRNWIKSTINFLFIGFFVAMVGVGVFGYMDNVKHDEDVIVVLGCGIRGDQVTTVLAERLDTAIELYRKNTDSMILVSGGQGPMETISEAEAMKKYLESKGVSETKILIEPRSKSTEQNIIMSKTVLDSHFIGSQYKCVFISNRFHMLRISILADKHGLEFTRKAADDVWYTIPVQYMREVFAIVKELVVNFGD